MMKRPEWLTDEVMAEHVRHLHEIFDDEDLDPITWGQRLADVPILGGGKFPKVPVLVYQAAYAEWLASQIREKQNINVMWDRAMGALNDARVALDALRRVLGSGKDAQG